VLEIVELADPEPGPGEVLVRMEAVSINHLDLWVRRGVPGHTFPLPIIPTSDGAGTVAALGVGVRGVAVGDEVAVFPGVSCGQCPACWSGDDHLCSDYGILGESCDGLCAELATVPAANVLRRPAGLGAPETAAVLLASLTAWNMLVRRAMLQPGELVLVQVGGSGVSSAAIQIARLLGARVIATASSKEKCVRAVDLGAERCIDLGEDDTVRAVKEWSGGRGVDVVIDHVGRDTFAASMRSLARAGRYVTCGATTGPKVDLMLNHVFFKSLSILGSTMGSKGDLARILKLVEQSRLAPVIGAAFTGLEQVVDAHRVLEAREVFGKVVVRI
jgi:NADPH:quinone reductase-like Zn-dependent oxidoreductase